ncbi:uncharacterized protein MELLADRAFT_69688 [Melampsora larici-populina 98AG31]|uniref:Uncharacterized protein n=1 Tax=Melampsora larici-populina (strain 98AG31 / pathotype 3-4-7) TaxID=747676 RepID=F4SBR7_MELLP|nr:uncharacterized protein MELLADRAFT_69688 [Melampsora larici-populina 98AG31]EGF97920.1 hypothetical protein MELLADRAFT_69688 [Melampsora larici-populina 98AG31]
MPTDSTISISAMDNYESESTNSFSESVQAYVQNLNSIDQAVRTWLQNPMSSSLYSCLKAVLSEVHIQIKDQEAMRHLVKPGRPSSLTSKRTPAAIKTKTLRRSPRSNSLSRLQSSTLKARCIAKRKKLQTSSKRKMQSGTLLSSKSLDKSHPAGSLAATNIKQHTSGNLNVTGDNPRTRLNAESVDNAALIAFEKSLSQDDGFDILSDGRSDDAPNSIESPSQDSCHNFAATGSIRIQPETDGEVTGPDPPNTTSQSSSLDTGLYATPVATAEKGFDIHPSLQTTNARSFWLRRINLYRSQSVQMQAIIPAEVKSIHNAALALLNALARGSLVSFDPTEVLPQAVTFDNRKDPGIRMWCKRAESMRNSKRSRTPFEADLQHYLLSNSDRKLFCASEQTSWYKPDVFDFNSIDNYDPPKDIPIHDRYLWDTIRMFHNPSPTFVERAMHYVMAAVVLVGMDCNTPIGSTKNSNTNLSAQTSLNAISCWSHYKELSYMRWKSIKESKSNSPDASLKDLDRLIASIYSLVVAFTSIWASVTLDADIEACNNLLNAAITPDTISKLTVQKEQLSKAREAVDIEQADLPPLVSFLCSGVTGLMIYPNDKNSLSTLRAVNFMLVTCDLMEPDHSFHEPVWRRTQSYIVQFLKDIILCTGPWVPRELNRYHLAKALFLDFSGFWLAQNISKISIPKSRNYKIGDQEYL